MSTIIDIIKSTELFDAYTKKDNKKPVFKQVLHNTFSTIGMFVVPNENQELVLKVDRVIYNSDTFIYASKETVYAGLQLHLKQIQSDSIPLIIRIANFYKTNYNRIAILFELANQINKIDRAQTLYYCKVEIDFGIKIENEPEPISIHLVNEIVSPVEENYTDLFEVKHIEKFFFRKESF